ISASGAAMSLKRSKYISGQDNNNGNDNDLFVLQYNPAAIGSSTYNALYPTDINPNLTPNDITGIFDKYNQVNIGLTPKTCLIRRAYYEIGFFYDSDPNTEVYKFK